MCEWCNIFVIFIVVEVTFQNIYLFVLAMAFFEMSLTDFHIAQKDNEIVPRNFRMSVCKITLLLLSNAKKI